MGKVQVGKLAPDFNCTGVVDGRLKEVSLSGYSEAKHWLILVFFPKAWSFICPTEIKAFSARLEEFLHARSCGVVFASTDSEYCLRAWNAADEMEGGLGGVHVPLVSDSSHKLSKDYGVLIEEQGIAQRALFIIDPERNVRSMSVNDANVGRSVDETMRVLDALVFGDEFGEGCPVDWKKGDKGINTTTPLEGKVDLKKSWSEWARPKLQRAWSGKSSQSINGRIVNASQHSLGNANDRSTTSLSTYHSGQQSPMLSPTSTLRDSTSGLSQMEDTYMRHKMENIEAAMANQSVNIEMVN